MKSTIGDVMYSKAKKVAGYWTILLESSPLGPVQFRSLSRAAAKAWREANEPPPTEYQLNATTGAAVWRGRDSQ